MEGSRAITPEPPPTEDIGTTGVSAGVQPTDRVSVGSLEYQNNLAIPPLERYTDGVPSPDGSPFSFSRTDSLERPQPLPSPGARRKVLTRTNTPEPESFWSDSSGGEEGPSFQSR